MTRTDGEFVFLCLATAGQSISSGLNLRHVPADDDDEEDDEEEEDEHGEDEDDDDGDEDEDSEGGYSE
jgi:hypothetical protein